MSLGCTTALAMPGGPGVAVIVMSECLLCMGPVVHEATTHVLQFCTKSFMVTKHRCNCSRTCQLCIPMSCMHRKLKSAGGHYSAVQILLGHGSSHKDRW